MILKSLLLASPPSFFGSFIKDFVDVCIFVSSGCSHVQWYCSLGFDVCINSVHHYLSFLGLPSQMTTDWVA